MTDATPVTHKSVVDLEAVLTQLLAEQRKMVAHIDAHTAAMKAMDSTRMEQAARLQESARVRITALDSTRRGMMAAIARQYRMTGQPKLGQLAEMFPLQKPSLLKLRNELRTEAVQLAHRNHVAGRLAGALLGHLNTAVRFVAGSVSPGTVYTKHGVPRIGGRSGLIEAVG